MVLLAPAPNFTAPDGRYWSEAEINEDTDDVRFTPQSGRQLSALGCSLSAISGSVRHSPTLRLWPAWVLLEHLLFCQAQ